MGFAAVLMVHSFSMTSFHIIFVRGAVRRIDNSTIEAARALGAGSFRIFTQIGIPILKPAIYAATLLLFLGALGSHAAPFILGGRDFEMINSLIQVLNSIRRVDMAALLSLVLGLGLLYPSPYFSRFREAGSLHISQYGTRVVHEAEDSQSGNERTDSRTVLSALRYLRGTGGSGGSLLLCTLEDYPYPGNSHRVHPAELH